MNIEIKEKFDNFVKIIENKEKIEWLKQITLPNEKFKEPTNSNNIFNNNDCLCQISSGYSSETESKKISKIDIEVDANVEVDADVDADVDVDVDADVNNNIKSICVSKSFSDKSYNKNNLLNSIKYKNSFNNKYDELSLLEDDYFICVEKNLKTSKKNLDQNSNNKTNNITNNITNKLTIKTIGSEFQNIFTINDDLTKINKIKKNESSEIKNKLENIYNKIIIKNPITNKSHGYKISEYLELNKLENKKKIDYGIKKLSELLEHVFNESTRGWNYEHNLYILQLDKLKENFEKVIFTNGITKSYENLIKIGFLYRNFNDPKVYLDKDFSKHWVGFDISSNNSINPPKIAQTIYQIKNKILYYCLKNLIKSNKFKKKISKMTYKFIKKTVQIYGNKDLIVDIILFVGIENIDNIDNIDNNY